MRIIMMDVSQLSPAQRKLWGLMVLGIAVAAFGYGTLQFYTAWSQAQSRTTPFKVTVTGEGKLDAVPDIGVVTGTVITTGKTVDEAEAENSKKANAVVASVKSQGVEDKDIQTGQFSVNPQYQYYNTPPCLPNVPCPPQVQKPPEIVSYEVRNSVTVKVRGLKTVGAILKGMTASGANEVNGPQFTIDDPNAVEAQARQKAIANAKEKAQTLASDLGLRLGKVVEYSEGNGVRPMYEYAAPQAMGMAESKAAVPAPPIEAGSQKVDIAVSVTYELK